ncbi:hypothetical protein [Methanoculleus bourgensis]|uniref:Uncharacterized protein n=1 Tax=Methanoculleus bourgensis TaxID=83986 RepID=A0A0X3BHQ2_9EURY|nr:hypothetical protein [Methanoculleus bourgensis]CVK31320.1 protein of unknown function [Methanoculleus bourgensis]
MLFADRNGRPFVYHYPVESGGTTIGSIKIAARTVLGGPVMDYGTTPPTAFDPDDAVSWAIAATERIYPGCSVRDARPCYASPVAGVLVRAATADGTETCLLFDPASGRMVDEWVPTEEDAVVVDHLGRILDQDEAEGRVVAWHEADVRYRGTLSFAERHGINLRQPLSEEDFERYVDFFENLAVSPAPDTPIPEPDTAAWERELEEWQQRQIGLSALPMMPTCLTMRSLPSSRSILGVPLQAGSGRAPRTPGSASTRRPQNSLDTVSF